MVNAMGAEQSGGVVAINTRVAGIIRDGGKAIGVIVAPQHSVETREIRARVLADATGAWQNELTGAARGQRHRGSKGVHVAVPRERVGNRDAITMTSEEDGRGMFWLPTGPQTTAGRSATP